MYFLSFEWNELDKNCFPSFQREPLGGTVVELSLFWEVPRYGGVIRHSAEKQ